MFSGSVFGTSEGLCVGIGRASESTGSIKLVRATTDQYWKTSGQDVLGSVAKNMQRTRN